MEAYHAVVVPQSSTFSVLALCHISPSTSPMQQGAAGIQACSQSMSARRIACRADCTTRRCKAGTTCTTYFHHTLYIFHVPFPSTHFKLLHTYTLILCPSLHAWDFRHKAIGILSLQKLPLLRMAAPKHMGIRRLPNSTWLQLISRMTS